jgi:hypothetical protein
VKDDAAPSHTMDTAKVIQVGQSYYAVYSSGGQPVRLATATTPTGSWHVVTTLDDQNGSQPYLAQEPDGSFLLADEHVDNAFGDSGVLFKQYANLRALENADAVRQFRRPICCPPAGRAPPWLLTYSLPTPGTRRTVLSRCVRWRQRSRRQATT